QFPRLCMSCRCSRWCLRRMLLVRGRLPEDDGCSLMETAGKIVGADGILEFGARRVVLRPKPEQKLGVRRPALEPACREADVGRYFQVDTGDAHQSDAREIEVGDVGSCQHVGAGETRWYAMHL